jgi:hypothetical protein
MFFFVLQFIYPNTYFYKIFMFFVLHVHYRTPIFSYSCGFISITLQLKKALIKRTQIKPEDTLIMLLATYICTMLDRSHNSHHQWFGDATSGRVAHGYWTTEGHAARSTNKSACMHACRMCADRSMHGCACVAAFFFDKRRIILYDRWVRQHITSTLDYKIVPTLWITQLKT